MKLTDLFQQDENPNLLFIITDQERSLEHFPPDFCELRLPAMTRLKRTGISLEKAFTPTCMCSPSRATFLTSAYPSVHGVTTTASPQPLHSLPNDIPNLASVVKRAGYTTIEWQGKWHLGKTPLECGFTGWSPPDAGNYLQINDTLGGGTPDNDGRFLDNIVNFLITHAHDPHQPWCLVISFVNPHDVYVSQYDVETAGYSENDLYRIHVPLPDNCFENLESNNKPRAQERMSWNQVHHEHDMQAYINFYAHLHTIVDSHIGQVLKTLDDLQMTENTLVIRFADHGEQALSHGLVEKFYNAYDESMHIPLVISNPQVYTSAQSNDALVSLLDVVPTIADLLGVATEFQGQFYGSSLVPILNNNNNHEFDTLARKDEVIHFCYDDIPAKSGVPSIIRCVRTRFYKYAVYFVSDGSDGDWELYNLMKDPKENANLAGRDDYAAIQFVLEETLQCQMRNYETLPILFEWPPKQTKHSRGGPPPPQII